MRANSLIRVDLQLQQAMDRQNQQYQTISNVMKTRHETVKNSISNVR